MGPDPAVAVVRLAVRRVLEPRAKGGQVLVACSGGADSLALLSAAVFECRRAATRVVGAVVDHGLQPGSEQHTSQVVAQLAALGVDETASVRVTVDSGPAGIEAGARQARYAALSQLAEHLGAATVLLGHTRDDQAETVLLGLNQGSGGRSISGMRRDFRVGGPGPDSGPRFVRPLLDLTRAQTEAACLAEGIAWWDDPHNRDPRFVRSRVRHTVMPVLERELGPGVAASLARTGHLLRDDLDALDDIATAELAGHDFATGVAVRAIEQLPRAVRTRVLRTAALQAGCPARELTHDHVLALEEMVWRRRGEPRDLDLPGHLRARRRVERGGDVLCLVAPGDTRDAEPPPVAG
jgi:tRNA(Ile)-lysidine synthase